jgi:antitoxin ParD1/3/4
MPASYALGPHFEEFVQTQVESGRYKSASEVLCDAVRLMEVREHKLAALDGEIQRGMADIAADRVHDADVVFDELEAKYARLAITSPGITRAVR